MLFVKLPTFLKEIGLPHEGAEEILFNITAYYIKTPIVLFLEEIAGDVVAIILKGHQ